jgi:RNA polymerase sigma-70 factor (sigma-E family)
MGGSPSSTFACEYPALYERAFRVAFRLLGDREEAEDVAQESCVRACVRWRRLTRRGPVEPWVVRVSPNLAIDRWRRRRVAKGTAERIGRTESDPADSRRIDLHRALRTLSPRQRQVVVLRYVADVSEDDVAAELGCSVGSVKTHASRGLAALRAQLEVEEMI